MSNKIYVVVLLIALLLGSLSQVFLFKSDPADNLENIRVYQPVRPVGEFNLSQHTGMNFQQSELLGRWTFLFLGYTHCPDICPTTMLSLAAVYPELKAIKDNVQVVMISADPQRDSLAVLKEYVPFFHPEFIGVTAPHPQLLPFTQRLGLVYSMTEGENKSNYLVNHSASIVLINPEGNIAALIKPDFTKQPPSVDFKSLILLLKNI
ncbi:SCO family protein [Algibacillus agarilyticus]|uniref:SCO family protein n=1 Tax=Algibacillus agarilyticus TaxID=2234133 RepID=UPI000DD001D6|nr:SCO family protein [Algibacillus agarilyticus]